MRSAANGADKQAREGEGYWAFQRCAERAVVRLQPASVCDEQTWLIADALADGGVLSVIDLAVRGHVQRGELVPVLPRVGGLRGSAGPFIGVHREATNV